MQIKDRSTKWVHKGFLKVSSISDESKMNSFLKKKKTFDKMLQIV